MNKLLILLAILLSAGSFWLADRAVHDLPPRINVDGRLLRTRVVGTGSPAVVLEIGLGGPLETYELVQDGAAEFTQVFAYDRIGAVDTEEKRTGVDVAHELRAALRKTGVEPPFVLVGHSFGGVYNRIFASLYPDEVAGMVLLDPTHEDFLAWLKKKHPEKEIPSRSTATNWAEGAGIIDTLAELKTAAPLPNVPIFVITGTKKFDDPERMESLPAWTAVHKNWATSHPQGRHIESPESGHGVQVEVPDLVVDLLREIVMNTRNSEHQGSLPPSPTVKATP